MPELRDARGDREEELELFECVLDLIEGLMGSEGLDISVAEVRAQSLVDSLGEDLFGDVLLQLILVNKCLQLKQSLPDGLQLILDLGDQLVIIDLAQQFGQSMDRSS